MHLVLLCYERRVWFRMFREPLVMGMRLLSWWHGVDPNAYPVRAEACRGCIRFRKNVLKQVSPTFRVLNGLVNPWFNSLRDSLVTEQEKLEAKRLPAERGLGN